MTPAIAYLYISQPELVFEAPVINWYKNGSAYVALEYGTPTSGSYLNIEAGMTLDLYSTTYGYFLGRTRIRSANSTYILLARTPRGQVDGQIDPESFSATIRVYKERRIWSKIPYIAPDGTQYKDEQTYPGDNGVLTPVANIGADVIVITEDASANIPLNMLGTIPSLNVSDSESGFPSYLWDIDDCSLVSGTLDSTALTVSAPRGERYVRVDIEDQNGTPHTAYKFVVVAHPDDCIPVQITEETIRADGVSLKFRVDSAHLPTTIRDGAKVLYTQHSDYNGGNQALRFSGWLGTEAHKLRDAKHQKKDITIEALDIAGRLKKMYLFPITVSNEASATGWYKLPNVNIDLLMHHFLQWHTNALDLADFAWSDEGEHYPLPRFSTQGDSVWSQADNLARAIGHVMVCTRDGALLVKGDPLTLATTDQQQAGGSNHIPVARNSGTSHTVLESDYGEWDITRQPPNVYWYWASAVVAGTDADAIDAVKAVAPGLTPGQGVTQVTETEQLVVSQIELNARTANRYNARLNPRFGVLTLNMVNNATVEDDLDPALMRFVSLTTQQEWRDRFGWGSTEKCLPIEIRNRYDHRKAKKTTEVDLLKAVEGGFADTFSENPDSADDTAIPPDDSNNPPSSPVDAIGAGTNNIAMFLSDGTIAVTNDFLTPSWEGGPSWTVYDHSATLGSDVLQWCYLANASVISGFLLTPTKIIFVANAQAASPTFTTRLTFGASSDDANIESDYIQAAGLFALVARIESGLLKTYASVDGGANWGSAVDAGEDGAVSAMPSVTISTATAGKAFVGTQVDTSPITYDDEMTASLGAQTRLMVVGDTYISGYPTNYLTADATYSASGGRTGGGCVTGGTLYGAGQSNPNKAFSGVVVDLGAPMTVTSASLWYRSINYTGGQVSYTGISYYDEDDNIVSESFTFPTASSSWQQWSRSGSVANVRYVVFKHWLSRIGSQVSYLDDISVTYQNPQEGGVAQTVNFGSSWNTLITNDDADALSAGLHAPYPNEDILFAGEYDSINSTNRLQRYRTADSNRVDIAPSIDGVPYAPDWHRSRFTLATNTADDNQMTFVGTNYDHDKWGVFLSNNSRANLPSYIILKQPSASVPYRRCALTGQGSALYLWGINGSIAYSPDPTNPSAIDDRTGNLSTSAEVLGIAGF